METKIKHAGKAKTVGPDFFERLWEASWTYIKTVTDVVREPLLILDNDLRVMAANGSFYKTFRVTEKDTEKMLVYDLGSGQWNIPSLRRLLETIVPKHTYFKGFEVAHDFPLIGRKTMLLNARQIFCHFDATTKFFPPIILLAMEDITEMVAMADTITGLEHTYQNHV